MNDTSQTTTAPVPARRGRPRRRRAGLLVLLSVAVLFVFSGLGFLALTGAPVEAPDWVTTEVEKRLNRGLGGGRVTVGGIEVAVDGAMVPRLRLRNVGIIDSRGAEVARLNEVSARLTAPALLQGAVQMRSLRVRGAQITVRRLSDGTFDLSLGNGIGASGTLAGVLDRIEQTFATAPLSGLERIEAAQLTITLEDARSGRLWQVTEGRIVLLNGPNSIRLTVTADVFNGTEDLATTVLEFETDKGSPQASLSAVFENAAAADIAAQSPALSFLEVLDAPISGSLAAEIAPDGDVGGLEGALEVGGGVLQPTPESKPIRIDGAEARVAYDAARQRLRFEELSLATAAAKGRASGQAFLKDFAGRWPQTMVTQFRLSAVEVKPEGMFAEPMTFAEGAVDFRLQLNPFTVEIGQLSLVDEDRRFRGAGEISADDRGWNASLDLALNLVPLDRLLALWPVNVAEGAREWMATNVSTGHLKDLTGAFRMDRETPKGMLSLSFSFGEATVKAMKTLPPITGAAGYASLTGETFTAVVEQGEIAAPQGGAVDVAGSYMRVRDVTVKPGRAEITVKTDSTITAALSLMDLPPFEILKKAKIDADVAEGRARLSGDVRLALVKQLDIEEIEYDAAGTLTELRSERLVEGRVVSAERLELRANPTGIAISGKGRLGKVPANVVWSQQFGPEHAGQSVVEGTIALGQAFLDEFNIGLPPGSVTGEGVGSIRVDLDRGAPPAFRLVSDLNRLGLRLPALNWSKPVNRTGRLEVAGTMGAAPTIDRIEIEAPGLSASGVIGLTDSGSMARADFDRVRVGGWLDGPVTLIGRGGAAPQVRVTGGTVDLREASFGPGAGNGGGGGPLSLQLDRLIVSEGIAFTDFAGEFETRGGFQGNFTARVNGRTPVRGTVVNTATGSAVRLRSDNAGRAMEAAGVLKNARGGSLELTLVPTGREGIYDGWLRVRNTRIVRAPAITELLSAISIVGLIDQMNSGGITMSEVDARFQLSPERLTLLQSSGVGPSLGISLDGVYNLTSGEMNMQGVVSPVYFLNAVGQVFSRRGEGLFGFSFRIRGQADNPSVSVNPLSILTPGMFRNIFRSPPPTPTQ
ncbi:AsmA-like C-terminal region-containing protein [Psychromarinibacter sp. C21-152]|uniref:AsmA-like C-terminal region-containing protein n=1 Tax=Psychromarinibacter sediminicola TaxID=3033385 RepID=A0AAE3NQ07_9RHOB|nr:AsmA-like C-terminal region-containing protein [Psychromarinibacter sediminicola]MDF0601408.1 AsmA-like C-terminal region-containing protein [Psychromarinibacter sediminicola]